MLRALTVVLSAGAACVAGYPGMNKLLSEIQTRGSTGDSTELIGDLLDLSDSQLTPVGYAVKQIITGGASGQSSETYGGGSAAQLGSSACAADTCCIWQHISNDMASHFRGSSGRCNDLARQAIRLGFHDAAGWSKAAGRYGGGGADGSIVLAAAEMQRPANRGMEQIVAQMKTWYGTYSKYNNGGGGLHVSMADLIQLGAITATVVCPLGPRVRFFAGRNDSDTAAPDGLLPSPFESADVLLARFHNMTIEPNGLTALVGAHTTSQQQFVDPSRAGNPQDGTPGVWDVLFYKQTLGSAPPRVFKFQSDINLSKDPRCAPGFQAFAASGGQAPWDAVSEPLDTMLSNLRRPLYPAPFFLLFFLLFFFCRLRKDAHR